MESPRKVDDVLHARWVIPIVPDGVFLEDHSVIIHEGKLILVFSLFLRSFLLKTCRENFGYTSHQRSETKIYK